MTILEEQESRLDGAQQPPEQRNPFWRANDAVDSRWRELISRFHVERTTSRMVALVIASFALFAILAPQIFLSGINLRNIGIGAPEIGILAVAMMLAMLTGGIDLSLVSIANLTAITVVTLYSNVANTNPGQANAMLPLWILLGLAVGVAAGALNGWLVAFVGITPILATLGTMQIFNGLAVAWTGGSVLSGVPAGLTAFGSGTLFGIPWLFVLFLLVAAAVAVVLKRTPLGVKVRLQGANAEAARYSGIRGRAVLMSTYLLSGLIGGIAGLAFISRNPTASADYGATYVLLAIVICVLGGTNPNGGFATVLGVVLATLTLQIVASGFNAIRLSSFEYQMAQGLILIAVMIIDQINRRHIQWPWRRRMAIN